jgi:predicted transcriptional regulator
MGDAANPDVEVEEPSLQGEVVEQTRLAWEADRIDEALASARAGRVVSREAVRAWVDSWDTPGELPKPRPGQ